MNGKILYSLLLILFGAAVCLFLAACALFNQPRFGTLPEGERLARIEHSPHYREGKFQNLIETPKFSQDVGMGSLLWSGLFDRNERLVPDSPVPVRRTDLKALSPETDALVWLGHSSWFVQVNGRRILVDPILSDFAAPFSFLNKAFAGTSIYRADDMPEIDYLLISHDHWDHLDYPTVTALRSRVGQVICPLGVGSYFQDWGYPAEKIYEGDWGDSVALGNDMTVHLLPARHYSGRLFKESKTLWTAFAIQTPDLKIFFSGDSGYGPHFADIGKTFGGFDLVLLDCGQYDPRWAYIHMTPEEAARAAGDLGARAFLPVHVGRFTIANHAWDEPFVRLARVSRDASYRLLTPEIGMPVALDPVPAQFPPWWEAQGAQPQGTGGTRIDS